jgi:hypothetical protein
MDLPPDLNTLASRVVAQSPPVAMVVAGAASSAIASLLSQPGSSRVVLDAQIPYSRESLATYIGSLPDSLCSVQTARLLAWQAWYRARRLAPANQKAACLGVACTAALATLPPRRGSDRAHLALCDGLTARCFTANMGHGGVRQDQELLVSAHLLRLMLQQTDPGLVPEPDEPPNALGETLAGTREWCHIHADGRISDSPAPGLVISGSFNPLHAGHVRLARVAQKRTGLQAVFELTLTNPDKPDLAASQMLSRMEAFGRLMAVVVSRLGTFEAKAKAWPGATFVVGIDTALRVVQPRFYGGTRAGLATALGNLKDQGCRFLVAGRATESGEYRTVADLPDLSDIPGARDLFEEIPEGEFRLDLSSTDIRSNLVTSRAD